ncbi:MAG: J domain-containing protein [Chloroflexota bacterium]
MAGKDYYKILGVDRKATEKEVKQAYRKLARRYHPDVNPGDQTAEARFKEINQAYEVLSDKDKRQKYDRYGDQWQYADQFERAGYQQAPSGGFGGPGQGGGQGSHFDDFDLGSIFGDLFGRGSSRRRPAARRGTDLEHPVEISLEEAYHGTSRMLNLQVEEPCASCQGTGRIQNALCSVCRGAGMVPGTKRLEVKIPPGVNTGSRVRLAGKGGPGQGGPNGDLYLLITVKPHQKLERRGDDLYAEVPVPLVTALLGGEVEVPTIKGKVSLKIPPETQNEQSFRLGGQGMPHLGDSRHGDLKVKVKIVLPQKLSAEEKQLFEQLRELRPGG